MDIKNNTYQIKALLSSGLLLDLTKSVNGQFEWGEQKGELAQRLSVTFANANTPKGRLRDILALCTQIYVYANGSEVFRGTLWDYSSDSGSTVEIPIVAYDHMKYTLESSEHAFFPSGFSTYAMVSNICKRWGIPLKYTWQSWTHPKTVFRGSSSIADEILDTLNTAQKHISSKYTALMDRGVFNVRPRGVNTTVYSFLEWQNALSVRRRITMDGLVTKVVIYGKEDKEGRSRVMATINGKLSYGTLQKVVYQDGDKTIATAKSEANDMLREKGSPTVTNDVSTIDVPFIRKGDHVIIRGGGLNGHYNVDSITHDAINRTMSMEVSG